MQLWLALRMRIFASSWACTDATISTPTRSQAGRPSQKSVLDHPLDEALAPSPAPRRRSPVAAFTRSATSGGGRGVMRSTIAFGQVVWASTQSAQRGLAARRRGSRAARRESARRCCAGCRSSAGSPGPPPRRMRARRIAARRRRSSHAAALRGRPARRRCRAIEPVFAIEVVAGLGDGERDDARSTPRRRPRPAGQRRLPRHHLADRSDALVAPLAGGRHRLQRVGAALRRQRRERSPPCRRGCCRRRSTSAIARLAQPVQVDGLVGAMERARGRGAG